MSRWLQTGVVLAAGLAAFPAHGQNFERDVTITGPRGRSVERQTDIHRGPGGIDRNLTIRRPGGTFQQSTHIGRPPAFVGGGGRGWGPPGRNVFVERDVFVNRGGGGLSGVADFGIGAAVGAGGALLLNKMFSPPPPPVYVAPVAPVYVTPGPPVVVAPPPPPVVEYVPPVRYQQPAPSTTVVDPVAMAIGRLSSHHDSSRRDGAVTLGRLGDARAVPALIDRLKNDRSKDVRTSAALALGEIGDPRGAIVLERAIIYEKKQEVRDAAAAALAKMPRGESDAVATAPGAPAESINLDPSESNQGPVLESSERVPPAPTPANVRR